jgi:hypothetical protein
MEVVEKKVTYHKRSNTPSLPFLTIPRSAEEEEEGNLAHPRPSHQGR